MTDIHTPTVEGSTGPQDGVLRHLDPNELEIGDNVREYANLTKPFLSSIAEHGVLVPLTAVQRPDGVIEVRNGQRRAAAARELGLASVPVYVLPAAVSDASTEVVDRIVHQLVTNDQKFDLSDAQRARGIQQMIDAGLSVTKVAKKLSVSTDTVKAAETAAGSAAALEALEVGQLSLVEAAALTEVDDDPDAVARLLEAAGTPRFDHVLAQIKADRISAEARAQEAARYTAQGFAVLDDRPYGWHMDCIPARDVWVTGTNGEPIEVDPVNSGSPQAWAVWLDEYVEYADRDSGEVVEEDAVDWNTEGDPGAVPEDGLRHADTVVERTAFEPNWYCLDSEAAGVQVLESFVRNAQWAANRQHGGESPSAPVELDSEATDADREAAAARAAAERAEADKRERRKVVTLNKLGAAAIGVRRAFVTTLVVRKTPPKGSAQFIASCLARDSFMLTHHQVDDVAAELLGIQGGRDGLRALIDGLPANGDGRAQVITLALVLAALEVKTTKEAWRSPAPLVDDNENASRYYRLSGVTTGDYLRWLAGHEYALSEVEQVVTGQRSADEVFDGLTAQQ
ncbi:ParB/RepB/Spo0J family partition protein [Mycolicibacterium septicum]|uniref:ParB/RepB/Spo0J family partition protein n=1 Tax=Mycolicibacterium septicum TaxID=98668 RepID=UPI002362F5A6|nr:ParB N-terminal domain-containing protein [Mycolicibacterium septicum]